MTYLHHIRFLATLRNLAVAACFNDRAGYVQPMCRPCRLDPLPKSARSELQTATIPLRLESIEGGETRNSGNGISVAVSRTERSTKDEDP